MVLPEIKLIDLKDKYFRKKMIGHFSDELIVRREITNQGKSRAFINDTPVQLSVLKALTEKLIHIHSQHHTLELKNADFQFDILDYLTDSFVLRTEFKQAFINLKAKQKNLEEKKTHFQKVLQEEDYTTFQLGELEKLNLEKISYSNLEQELEQMEHFDTIQNTFSSIHASLSENNAVIDKLTNLKATLERNKAFHPFFAAALERINSVNLELKDIAFEVESYQEGLEYWNIQLENAKMTKILSSTRPTPPASVSEIRTLKQTVSLGHLAAYGMTPDIALKAAWSIVLSTISLKTGSNTISPAAESESNWTV